MEDNSIVNQASEWSKSWEVTNSQIKGGVNPHAYRLGWLDKASQEKGIYSEDDIRKAFRAGQYYQQEGIILQPDEHGYIQSLNQSKQP